MIDSFKVLKEPFPKVITVPAPRFSHHSQIPI